VARLPSGDLIDFIEKDNPSLLHPLDGQRGHLIHVDQPLGFFFREEIQSLGTFTRRRLDFLGSRLLNISFRLMSISSMPALEKISTIGRLRWVNSSSTSRSSSLPVPQHLSQLLAGWRRFPVIREGPSLLFNKISGTLAKISRFLFEDSFRTGGRRRSSIRSSAISRALAWTFSFSSARTCSRPAR